MDQPLGTKRNEGIDALRAVAILLVMIVHFPRFRQMVPVLYPWSGVDLFFVISGFVVAKSFVPRLDSALEAASDSAQRRLMFVKHTKAFFVRRLMRIMPALVFALVFYLSVGIFVGDPALADRLNLLREVYAIFSYSYNFVAAYATTTVLTWHWSLALEEQFYFVFPFFIGLVTSDRRRVAAIVGVIIFQTFILRPWGARSWFGAPPLEIFLPQVRGDVILWGLLLFFVARHGWLKVLKSRVLAQQPVLNFLLHVFLISLVALAPELAMQYSVAIPIIGFASAALVFLALTGPGMRVPAINPIIQWIGLRSYGIYLLHVPVVRLTQQIESRWLAGSIFQTNYAAHFALVIITLVALVEFSYRVIEVPAMEVGSTWSKEITAA